MPVGLTSDPAFHDSNGPWKGIKRSLHEGGIRVPWIARWPGHIPAGSTSAHPIHFADLFATAASLAGRNATVPPDSHDVLPALRGEECEPPESLYWEFYEGGSAQAVRFGKWKAIRAPMFDGTVRLYDLESDTGEEHDLAGEHPDEVRRAVELMEAAHEPSELWRVRGR